MKMQFEHISVLTQEVVDFAPESTQTILDCTLGGGDTAGACWKIFRTQSCTELIEIR
jgi:16S rRNA C1402 N4-methylase RsmH